MINLYLLLVDDESDIRQTVAASLALDPFFILRDCASGAETLAAAVVWRPDFILLDVMMPDMDGTDGAGAIARGPAHRADPGRLLHGAHRGARTSAS